MEKLPELWSQYRAILTLGERPKAFFTSSCKWKVVAFDDVVEANPHTNAFQRQHVGDILTFVNELDVRSILVHCDHGLSRSPAVCYSLRAFFAPQTDFFGILSDLDSECGPILPNQRVVSVFDTVLGFEGALLKALYKWYQEKPFGNHIEYLSYQNNKSK